VLIVGKKTGSAIAARIVLRLIVTAAAIQSTLTRIF